MESECGKGVLLIHKRSVVYIKFTHRIKFHDFHEGIDIAILITMKMHIEFKGENIEQLMSPRHQKEKICCC